MQPAKVIADETGKAKSRMPGRVELREYEYKRHGTQTLIAALNVTTGLVCGVVGETRTETDFVSFLDDLLSSKDNSVSWRIVCDNLNTHLSEGVVRLVAKHSQIIEDLGEKASLAFLIPWLLAKLFLEIPTTGSCLHSLPNMPRGSIRSRCGFQSWLAK